MPQVAGSGTGATGLETPPTRNCPIDAICAVPEVIVIELIGVELSARKPKKFWPEVLIVGMMLEMIMFAEFKADSVTVPPTLARILNSACVNVLPFSRLKVSWLSPLVDPGLSGSIRAWPCGGEARLSVVLRNKTVLLV